MQPARPKTDHEMNVILTWKMPMEPIGGAPADVLGVAMTEDGHLLVSRILEKNTSLMNDGPWQARFARRFPDGFRLIACHLEDERVLAAVKKNAALGEDGDQRL